MSDRLYQLDAGHDQDRTPVELLLDPSAVEVIPTVLEIYFSNVCNMACLYCGSHFSSKWEEENKKFGMFRKGVVEFGWPDRWNPNYKTMLADFWRYLDEKDRYKHIRYYQILGGEPFFQEEFDMSMDFWESHPNPDLTFNVISNLKVSPKKFQNYIDRFGKMIESGALKRLQITGSIDAWGPQQEYVRWGLDLNEWTENFEYLLDKPWVQPCINSAISALTVKTVPELIRRMNAWNDSCTNNRKISYSFMTIQDNQRPWMDPAIFGGGVFEEDFDAILAEMRNTNDSERSAREHMQGIRTQIVSARRNVKMINGLKDYLNEIDRRRDTDWKLLFPWLDQDWK